MQTQINFRTTTLYSDLKASGVLLPYTPEAYARLKAIQGGIEKRKEKRNVRRTERPDSPNVFLLDDPLYFLGLVNGYKEQPEIGEAV